MSAQVGPLLEKKARKTWSGSQTYQAVFMGSTMKDASMPTATVAWTSHSATKTAHTSESPTGLGRKRVKAAGTMVLRLQSKRRTAS